MTRLNGGVLLPQHEAAAQQQAAAVNMLRLQLSTSFAGQLLPTYLSLHRARALLAAGKPTDSPDSVTFDTTPAINGATDVAIAAADVLLTKLGISE